MGYKRQRVTYNLCDPRATDVPDPTADLSLNYELEVAKFAAIPDHDQEPDKEFAESKTRTYHERVGSGRTAAWRGGVGQGWMPTELFIFSVYPRFIRGLSAGREALFRPGC